MQFKIWLEKSQELELNYLGYHFKNNNPVSFNYLSNKEKSPYVGSIYQQDIEPHGKYITFYYSA
jgi:hypothetical protein